MSLTECFEKHGLGTPMRLPGNSATFSSDWRVKVRSRDVEESNDDLLLCALLFVACHGPREKQATFLNEWSRRERHGCVRQVFFVSCATSLARMKRRSVSPLFVKTQRVGLGMFADGHVASLTPGAAPRRITGCLQPRSPNVEARVNHPLRKPTSGEMIRPRCCAELQIVSCTSKKFG